MSMNRCIKWAGLVCLSVLLFEYARPCHAQNSPVQNKAEKAATKTNASKAPASPVDKALGDLKWGMTQKEVIDRFVKKIKGNYAEKLKKAPGALEEDRIRRKMELEIRQLYKGVVTFDGRSTGWDVSFLKTEYRHHQDESMITMKDGESQNFYFFRKGRFTKWYKAFESAHFVGKTFPQVVALSQETFGRGKEIAESKTENKKIWEWQSAATRVRLINQTEFYGFYSLVFEDKRAPLDKVKPVTTKAASGHLIDGVIRNGDESEDSNPDVVDRITGRKTAPKLTTKSSSASSSSDSKESSKESASSSDDSGKGKKTKQDSSKKGSSGDPLKGAVF